MKVKLGSEPLATVTARKLCKTGWSAMFTHPGVLPVTSCKPTEMSASVPQNQLPGFHVALLPLQLPARRNSEHPQPVFFSLNSSHWPKLHNTFAPKSETHLNTCRFDPTLEIFGRVVAVAKASPYLKRNFAEVSSFSQQLSNHQWLKSLQETSG